ncbi:hypothetical protein GCM10025771_09480 [Niveibacterium umoris]|uniref:DUF3301 domain-containing protein n=1 Tax=Niveibacterium umoris TaxID=1193620 RepID=A0A840BLK1_9RHOO|nr:DUF3301 domain-containing protein [Niveibacterium umoris]MBB4013503.1 hypothetical protein [Niveibacterium umoris]
MIDAWELGALLLLAGAVWLWLDSLRARDAGIVAARKTCEHEGVQLLDETVAIAKIRLARNDDGQLRLQRTYRFEFSDTGNNRRNGEVTLVGAEVVSLYTGPHLLH